MLHEEGSKFQDIIQTDDLLEHYDNLTLKTLYTLKFFIHTGKLLNM